MKTLKNLLLKASYIIVILIIFLALVTIPNLINNI